MTAAGRRWVVLVAAVLAAALTARLGVWQLDRGAQKQALQRAIDERGTLPPLGLRELAATPDAAEAQHFRQVHLQGRWLSAHTVFLDNRQMNGHPGFFVVTPLLLGPGDAVLVQRGWAPRDFVDRTHLPVVPTPEGVVSIAARIAPPPSRLFDFGGSETGPIRQNLDMAAFAREAGVPLRPLSLLQLDPAEPADGLQRQWPAPAVDVAKHHGYAFQWFALCALITGLYVWFQLIRPRLAARRAA